MGFNVSHLPPFWGRSLQPAVRTMTEAVRRLDREGWIITLIPTQPEEEPLAHEIARAIGSSRISVFRRYLEPKRFLDVLAAQDLFVGLKLHSVIASCCVYTPAIKIGYQPKCTDFMRTMDLERYLIRTDALELDGLMALVAEVAADTEAIRRKQFEQCQHYRSRLLDLRDRTLASVGVAPPPRDCAVESSPLVSTS
jgi:polysaccharide pyruvyl transferase WcaK-like protein